MIFEAGLDITLVMTSGVRYHHQLFDPNDVTLNHYRVIWFYAQVIGIKTLSNMMKTISSDAGLSQIYTNHCIRATCISTLDNNGFVASHIMSITGHKSEIRAYSKTGLET